MALLSNISFRWKLILVMTLPFIGMTLLATIASANRLALYLNQRQVQSQVLHARLASDLIHELQRERGLTAGFLGSRGENFRNELNEQRERSDQAESLYFPILSAGDYPPELASEIRSMAEERRTIRRQTDQLSIAGGEAIGHYTREIGRSVDFISLLAVSSSENSITMLLASYLNLIKSKENAGQERAVLNNTFALDNFAPGLYERFITLVSAQNSFDNAFLVTTPDEVERRYREVLASRTVERTETFRNIARERAATGGFNVNPTEWYNIQTEKIDLIYEVEIALAEQLNRETATLITFAFWQLLAVSGLSTLAIIISIALLLAIAGNLTRRTDDLLGQMEQITNGDLTLRLKGDGKDEVAITERRFNQMVETLHTLISGIHQTVISLNHNSVQLLQSSQSLSSEMEESSIQAGAISSAVEEMNMTLSNVSSSVEEMSITISEVAKRAATASSDAKNADEASRGMVKVIGEQAELTRAISHMMENITQIAGQTNLLALNASIEAAGAGEAGRGFAVVASEVKELARQSGEFSHEAKDQITALVAGVDRTVDSVEKISATIRSNIEAVVGIAAAVEEQSIAMREIASNVSQISTASRETASNVSGIADAAKQGARSAVQAAEMAKELEKVANQIKDQIRRFNLG